MRLASLTVETPAFSRGFTVEPVCVVLGPNESGKTTLLQAIDVAVRGQGAAAWDRFRERARIRASWSESEQLAFRVDRGVDGGRTTVEVNGRALGVKAADAAIRDALGDAALFDLGAWLALPLRDQLAEVATWSSVDPVGFDLAAVRDLVERRLSRPLVDTFVKLGISDPPAADARSWVGAMVAAVREVDLAANAEALRLNKIVDDVERGRADQRAALPPGTVAMWRGEVDRIDAQLGALRTKLGASEEADEAATRAQEALQTVSAALTRVNDQLDRATTAAREQQQRLAAVVARCDEQLATVKAAEAADESARVAATRSAEEVALLREELARAEGLHENERYLRDRLSLVADNDDVPMWARLRVSEVLERAGLGGSVLRDQLATKTNEHAGYAVKAAGTTRQLTAARASYATLVGDRDVLTKQIAVESNRIARLTGERSALEQEAERAQAAVLAAGTADTSAVRAAIDGLLVDRKVALGNADKLSDFDGSEAAHAQRILDRQEAVARRTLARDLQPILLDVQLRLVEAALVPMLRTASAITSAVYGYQLTVQRREGERSLVFFAQRNGGPAIRIEHASQSVRAVIGIALRAALLQYRRGWRALLVDDFEHVDPARRDAVIRAILDAGVSDTLIVAAVADGWAPAYPVIRLEHS